MQSDKPGTSRGYLHGVLVAGGKPFHYRGGVRSLLGIPDGESGNLAFAPTLPPVGFRYANYELRGEAYWATQHPPIEATHPALGSGAWEELEAQDITGENRLTQDMAQPRGSGPESKPEQVTVEPTKASAGLDAGSEQVGLDILTKDKNRFRQRLSPANLMKGSKTETPDTPEASQHDAPEKETVQKEMAIRDAAQSRGAGPELKQESGTVEPAAKPIPSDTAIEQASLEIPGVSEREQSFPALSPAKTDHAPADRTENRHHQRVSAARSRGRSAGTPQAGEGQLAQGGSQTQAPAMERREAGKHMPMPQKGVAAAAPDFVPVLEGSPKPERVKQRLVTTPVPVGPDQALEVQSVRPDIVNRSNTAAADKIEQLRRTVHQLTAKVASQPGQTDHPTKPQPPAQMPPPPAQPVVIIQRSSTQARTPHAFWERRYLGRFHLRTLR